MLGWQEQSQRSPCLLGGLEYGPQGLGLQGSCSTTGSTARTCIMLISNKTNLNNLLIIQKLDVQGAFPPKQKNNFFLRYNV